MNKKYNFFLGKTTNAYDLFDYLKDNGFDISVPVDVKKIMDFLEIPYSVKPNFKQIKLDGKISIENNEPLIWSNPIKISIEERKRFTLAHELGHFFLHIAPLNNLSDEGNYFEDTNISFNRDDKWTYKEMEANNFASQLLMPSSKLKEELKKIIQMHKKDDEIDIIKELAGVFFVSQTAMKYRLINMGIKL